MFSQARSGRFSYDKHFNMQECDLEITNLHYKKIHNTVVINTCK